MLSYSVLHRMGFTKLPTLLSGLVVFYTTVSPVSASWQIVYFLLHFPYPVRSLADGTPPVRRHPVLRCSDFPLHPLIRG